MYCKIIEDENDFKPFKLEIKVKTESDLIALWHRFNAAPTMFLEGGRPYTSTHALARYYPCDVDTNDIWSQLDAKVELYNLKNPEGEF